MRNFSLLYSLVCLLIAGWQQPLFSQVLPFDFYTIEDGLPSNWINCIYQDSRGYMWIATEEGVAVFDGVAFKIYNVADGIPDKRVTSIIESRISPGTMWIGTFGGGLCKFAGEKISTIRVGATTNSNIVLSVCEDDAGVVWCGTYEGVFQVRNDSAYAFPTEAPKGWTPFIKQTSDRAIWIGTGIGVFVYSPENGQTIRLLNNPTECMTSDNDGNVWICTAGGMINLFRDRRIVASRRLPIMSNVENNYRLLHDRDGTLWIGSGEGIAALDKNQFRDGEFIRYTVANGLRENIVSWFFQDRENILWLGSWNKGIAILSDQTIHSFPIKAVFPPVNNRAVAAAGPRHFFVAAQEGVWEMWKNRFGQWRQTLHRVDQSKTSGVASSVELSSDGALWAAFSDGGFCRYEISFSPDRGSVLRCTKTLTPGVDVPAGSLSATMIDDRDQMWYGQRGIGVGLIDLRAAKPLAQFTEEDGLPGNWVKVIEQDRHGNMMFGEFGQGMTICRLGEGNLQRIKKLTAKDGLPHDYVRAFLQRRSGEIWIGTRNSGVAIWDGDKFQPISSNDGLLSNAVFGFAEDENGGVWIATARGVQRTLPGKSQPLATHKKLTGKFIGTIGARDGVVWCLSNEEFTVYEPRDEHGEAVAPSVYITGLRMQGRSIPLLGELKFPHQENFCEIQFTGISFKDPQALRFQYKISGPGGEGQAITTQRTITYPGLPPGNYTFEVLAMTAAGLKSTSPATLAFTIVPPFWRRWWFIAIGVALLAAMIVGLERLRVRRLLEIEKIRSRIATDLHDDIGAGLTHIGLLSEVMLRKHSSQGKSEPPATQNVHERLDDFSENTARVGSIARELSEAMSDVVWSINPKHDSLDALLHRLRGFAHEICKAKDIALNFTIDEKISAMRLNPEERRSLLLIAKEALHNMAKYSGSASVEVRIESNAQMLRLMVQDFGRGFDASTASTGNGLSNMRSRAIKLGGVCEIHSKAGKGTRIVASIPVRK